MSSPARTAEPGATQTAADLLRAAADGDRDALAAIVDAHHGDMTRVAFVICGDRDVAADVVQSAWLRVATRLASVRDAARLRPWLCSVAANEARQTVRRRRRTLPLEAVPHDDPVPDRRADHLDLVAAMQSLEVRDRELLALRYVAGFSSAELADHFDLTAAGIRSRLKRLLDRLRRELEP